ncbi:MAG: thioesterase family protein [Polaromonas sp.]|uniref:thioesterase family protein n=1 Tax=Polaromonas sp. TaxID=1869339 RepID=UPI001818DF0A|nr:thioesterase family protein [Polaromonas sp.]MBA3593011.1 thioesterase family protein [Polaromonas sp.]
MSGLLRNLLTLLRALRHYRSADPQSRTLVHFRVTPLDTGIATLKSDRYLQMAESAQLDFGIKTGLLQGMLRQRYSFVNASQLVRFARPVRLFDRVAVTSKVIHTDAKCAYFQHVFTVGSQVHAEVFVKMKFKKGRLTIAPCELLGSFDRPKPAWLQHWDDTLAAAPQDLHI